MRPCYQSDSQFRSRTSHLASSIDSGLAELVCSVMYLRQVQEGWLRLVERFVVHVGGLDL